MCVVYTRLYPRAARPLCSTPDLAPGYSDLASRLVALQALYCSLTLLVNSHV